MKAFFCCASRLRKARSGEDLLTPEGNFDTWERVVFTWCFFWVGAGLLGILLLLRFLSGGGGSFPFDDTYIILEYARNFFERFEVAYNSGVSSSGITSPASMALVALVYGLIRDWTAAALFSSYMGWILTGLAGFFLARKELGITTAWVFAVLFPLSGRFLFHGLSGMDTMLFGAAALWALYFVLLDRQVACGLVLGLGWMIRPEMAFIAIPVGLWVWFRFGFKRFVVLALLAMAVASPWMVFCLLDTGSIFPATLVAKSSIQSGGNLDMVDFLNKAFAFWSPTDAYSPMMNLHPVEIRLAGWDKLLHGAPLLIAGWVAIALTRRSGRPLLLLMVAVLVIHFGVVFSRGAYLDLNIHRYFILNYLFSLLSSAYLVALVLESPRLGLRRMGWVGLAALMLLSVHDAKHVAKVYQYWCRHTYLLDGQTGQWIGKFLPSDAVIGLHNAGCVKWFGQRKTVDFAALTTTGMHERLLQNGFLRLVYDEGVTFFAYHGDEIWAKYGFPHMSKSPYFVRVQAPGRGVYQVRRDLLAQLFALEPVNAEQNPPVASEP